MVLYGSDSFGSRYGPVEGFCEHGYETSVSVKFWEFLE
jgi:hypothetical protein